MTINFREQAGGNVRPFRYFTQTVLPAVYDDSLSYMELVAKTIEYLNEVIESLNANNAAVTEMQGLLEQYKQYMDDYFENLDVQEEIDNKLDALVADGTMANLVNPVVTQLAPGVIQQWLDDHPEATTTVQDNSITDAKLVQTGGVLEEVHNIRTSYDGAVYDIAGDAVREPLKEITDSLDWVFDFTNENLTADGEITPSDIRLLSGYYDVRNGDSVTLLDSGYQIRYATFVDGEQTYIGAWLQHIDFVDDETCRFVVRKIDGSPISPKDMNDILTSTIPFHRTYSKLYEEVDTLQNSVDDLQNTVDNSIPNQLKLYNLGIDNQGVETPSENRLLSDIYYIQNDTVITLDSNYQVRLAQFVDDTFDAIVGAWTNNLVVASTGYYKLNFRKQDDSALTSLGITPHVFTSYPLVKEYAEVVAYSEFEPIKAFVNNAANQFSLNQNLVDADDMCWSWWYYPQVISFKRIRNKVYWGYTTSDGYTGIAAYDIDTGFTTKNNLKRSDVDDHNGLALYIYDDGLILCAYSGGHNTDNKMHIRRSSVSESIEKFETEIPLECGGTTSYGQFIKYGDKLYLFYRVNNTSWRYRYTSDKGLTWSDEVTLITATMQYYCLFRPTTVDGRVRICMYSNPGSDDSNIRMGFLDLQSGVVYNSDNSTQLGSSNLSHTLFNIIIPNETGMTQRLFDVAVTAPNNPLILYAPFSTYLDSVYKIYDAGTITTVCNGGEALWYPKYQDGAAWLGVDKIISIRGYQGRELVELYDYANNVATLNREIYSETKAQGNVTIRNARPIVDVNEEYFLWHRGYYNVDDYTDFNTDAMIRNI